MGLQYTVVDLSHYDIIQTDGFGKLARGGYKGVIHKATEGTGIADLPYTSRRRDCVDAGLEWGCYHFARRGDGAAQADVFLAHAQPDDSTLIALDWESGRADDGDTFTCDQARAFLDRVMAKTGRSPQGVYIYGGKVLKELIVSAADVAYFGQFKLWLSQYTTKPKLPKAWSAYKLWQASGDGLGPGPHEAPGITIAGGVDQNVVCDGFDFDRDWGAGKPAAAVPVTIADLVPVSRGAALTDAAKKALLGTTGASVVTAVSTTKETYNQISAVVANHWLAITVTVCVLGWLVFKLVESYKVDDANSGRYTPSKAA